MQNRGSYADVNGLDMYYEIQGKDRRYCCYTEVIAPGQMGHG